MPPPSDSPTKKRRVSDPLPGQNAPPQPPTYHSPVKPGKAATKSKKPQPRGVTITREELQQQQVGDETRSAQKRKRIEELVERGEKIRKIELHREGEEEIVEVEETEEEDQAETYPHAEPFERYEGEDEPEDEEEEDKEDGVEVDIWEHEGYYNEEEYLEGRQPDEEQQLEEEAQQEEQDEDEDSPMLDPEPTSVGADFTKVDFSRWVRPPTEAQEHQKSVEEWEAKLEMLSAREVREQDRVDHEDHIKHCQQRIAWYRQAVVDALEKQKNE